MNDRTVTDKLFERLAREEDARIPERVEAELKRRAKAAGLAHAITQPQPIAWALAAGHCPVIMSDTRPAMEHEGRLIGIHARRLSGLDGEQWLEIERRTGTRMPGTMPMGALVGVARLVGVVRQNINISDPGVRPGHHFQRAIGRGVWEHVSEEVRRCIRPWWRSGTKWGLLLANAVMLAANLVLVLRRDP